LERLIRTAVPNGAGYAARALINEFGSLAAVLAAGRPRLLRATANPTIVGCLVAVREAMDHTLRTRIEQGPIIGDLTGLVAYLNLKQGWLVHEQFRVLHLDGKYRLLADEVAGDGAPSFVNVDTRAILARAFEVGSTSIILVHNHPGGDPTPSETDILKTRSIAQGGRCAGLHTIDHIIVAKGEHYSFRAHGLL
jgi:DNA repair protein RadC